MNEQYNVVAVKVTGKKYRMVDSSQCSELGIGTCARGILRRVLKRYKLPVFDMRFPRPSQKYFDNLPCDHVVVIVRPVLAEC